MACDLHTAFRLLDLPKRPRSPVEADAVVRKGLPFHSLEALTAGSGLPADEVETILAIPPRTLARRKATRRFSLDESERLLRLALVVSYAAEVLGDRDAWLAAGATALLAVPSAIAPPQLNFVLNPAHPDARRCVIGASQAWRFKPRLKR